ncbi:MAG: hypothetical protein J6S96_06000 [Muribaculaceae bacterium]|nr:hypothetical protein [Muribaculaceae bacterium]
MKISFKSILAIICLLMTLSSFAESKLTYDTREWLTVNSSAVQMMNNDRSGNVIPFKPCAITNDFVAAKCKIVEYYDCAVYFDPDKRAVIFVDDSARADYYIIFADATNVNMGAGKYELFIECNVSPTKSYDLVYNVKTNMARKLADGDVAIISRFARRVPHICYKNPHDKISKLLHDYFKWLSAGDYAEAQKARNKIILKSNQDQGIDSDVLNWDNATIFNCYPLMELGEALMMSYPAKYRERDALNVPRDPFRGYQYVKQVYRRDTLLNDANSLLLSGDIRLSVDMIKKNIENELLNYARWEGTEEAYDRVLMTLYNSPIRNEARSEQEKFVYSKVAASGSVDDYLTYLNKFRGVDEGHFNFVEQRLFQMAYEQMPATAAGCREYLKNYPLSPLASEVRAKVSEYAYQELQPTSESCRDFLKNYPNSPHAQEVWYKLYEVAYDEIGDDLEKCVKYLNDYPNSQYCDQVQRKMLKIKYDKAVTAGTVAAYDVFLNENPYNTYTDDIKNRRAAVMGNNYGSTSHVTSIDVVNRESTPVSTSHSGQVVQSSAQQQQKVATNVQNHSVQQQPQTSQSEPKQKAKEPEKQNANKNNSSNTSTGTLWELDF